MTAFTQEALRQVADSFLKESKLAILDGGAVTPLPEAAEKAHRDICDRLLKHFASAIEAKVGTVASDESDLVKTFIYNVETGDQHRGIPHSPHDTIVTEYKFRHGRADVVIFHIDGSATIVEAKDGANGIGSVVAGIGQLSLYASQLRNVTVVRRALLWSLEGEPAKARSTHQAVREACAHAGVIPIAYPSIRSLRTLQVAAYLAAEALEKARLGASDGGASA